MNFILQSKGHMHIQFIFILFPYTPFWVGLGVKKLGFEALPQWLAQLRECAQSTWVNKSTSPYQSQIGQVPNQQVLEYLDPKTLPSVGICLTTVPTALASSHSLRGTDYYVQEGAYWMCIKRQPSLCWSKKLRKELGVRM